MATVVRQLVSLIFDSVRIDSVLREFRSYGVAGQLTEKKPHDFRGSHFAVWILLPVPSKR